MVPIIGAIEISAFFYRMFFSGSAMPSHFALLRRVLYTVSLVLYGLLVLLPLRAIWLYPVLIFAIPLIFAIAMFPAIRKEMSRNNSGAR
jgi:hypothetical protein